MKVLVSGAGGKTGRGVTAALAERGVAVRSFLRRAAPIPGATEAFAGDMTRAADWETALAGVDAVYHICPNMHPAEVGIGRMALTAARKAGVAHFVYHSVLHPQTEEMPHHWHKLRVEEMLFESGLPFTVLQPTAYMQNICAQWATLLETGVYAMPYPAASRISLVDLNDVAAVAALVLTEAGHVGATYELVGTAPLTQEEVARELETVIGRSVTVREIPLHEWRQDAVAAGLSAYAIDTLLQMFRYYAAHGLVGNPTVLRHLLGRGPTSLSACARAWR